MNFIKTVEQNIGGDLIGQVARALSLRASMVGDYPFIPCDAPGLPPPGPDIINTSCRLAGLTATDQDELASQIALLGYSVQVYSEATGVKNRRDIIAGLKREALRSVITSLYIRMLYDPFCTIEAEYQNSPRMVHSVPGHIWGDPRKDSGLLGCMDGIRQADLMFIGKFPSEEEFKQMRCMCGPSGKEFANILDEVGIPGWQNAYVTNLSKLFDDSVNRPESLPDRWIKDCLPVLHMEIRMVRPRYVVLLGAEPIKAFLGRGASVTASTGKIFQGRTLLQNYAGEDVHPAEHHYSIIACQHPASILHDPDHNLEPVRRSVVFLRNVLLSGPEAIAAEAKAAEADVEHTVIPDIEYLANLAADLRRQGKKVFSIDAEWQGRYPTDPGSYMRCLQFSWEFKKAALVPVDKGPGESYWGCGWNQIKKVLTSLWDVPGFRPVGHNFNADLVWTSHYGLRFIEKAFMAPQDDPDPSDPLWRPGYIKIRDEGGWDTMIGQHAIDEMSDLSLKSLISRYTTMEPYEDKIYLFLQEYCKSAGIGMSNLTGYGPVPDDLLFPYALKDADGTFRVFLRQKGDGNETGLMDSDRFGKPSWIPFWTTMRALPALLEMHNTGVLINVSMAEELMRRFAKAMDDSLAKLRALINWPDFNPNSQPQCRALLFGDRFGRDSKGNLVRPEQVIPLNLRPYKSTGKRPKMFDNIHPDQWDSWSPSTDKEVLSILEETESPVIDALQMYRITGQVLKIFRPKDALAKPKSKRSKKKETEKSSEVVQPVGEKIIDLGDDDPAHDIAPDQAFRIDAVPAPLVDRDPTIPADDLSGYSGGILSFVCSDRRVRSIIFPTTETGRCRSAKPNMQNVTFKRRKKQFISLLGDFYKENPISSVFVAPPGHILVQADYKGAELVGMAVQGQDRNMIDHCRRNRLPSSHPDHVCIHSKVAVRAFDLRDENGKPLRPVAAVLEAAGHSDKRDAAKPVDFGYAYGMQEQTAERRMKEQGVKVNPGDGAALIKGLEEEFPCLPIYFAKARHATQDPGYIESCFGRRRRFRKSSEKKVIAAQERQGMNFPIQALVADAVNIAMANYCDWKLRNDISGVRLILQVHDALVWEVPIPEAYSFVNETLRTIMFDKVVFWPVTFDGKTLNDPMAPYNLAYDVEIGNRYGVAFKSESDYESVGLNKQNFKEQTF